MVTALVLVTVLILQYLSHGHRIVNKNKVMEIPPGSSFGMSVSTRVQAFVSLLPEYEKSAKFCLQQVGLGCSYHL